MAEISSKSAPSEENPRPRGRPPKHVAHAKRSDELKVTLAGMSALESSMTKSSLDKNPICSIIVPHHRLLAWRQKALSHATPYISQLNENIEDHVIYVSSSCTRLEQRFVKRDGEIYTKASKPGRSRQQVMEKSTTFALFHGELVNFSDLTEEIDILSQEIECWKKELSDAEYDIQTLREEVAMLI